MGRTGMVLYPSYLYFFHVSYTSAMLIIIAIREYSSFKDPYTVLGVKNAATGSEIKRAYFDVPPEKPILVIFVVGKKVSP